MLSGNKIGLDIADNTISVVEMTKSGKVLNIGHARLLPGIVENGRIKNSESLSKAVLKVFSSAKPTLIKFSSSQVCVALPKSQLFMHFFDLEKHDKKEREKLVLEQISTIAPIEKEDILYNYKSLQKKWRKFQVFVSCSR